MDPAKRYRSISAGSHQQRSWLATYEALKDNQHALGADEHYELALAAYLTGKDMESIDLLSTTHYLFLENANIGQSIRCAFWIGMLLAFKGERARGSGWFARAHRLIEEYQYEGSENGLLQNPGGIRSFGFR